MKKRVVLLTLTACLVFLSVFPITALAQDENGWTYEFSEGNAKITAYSGPGAAVEIPEKLGGRDVTAIGSDAFTTVEITSLAIHKGVTEIEPGAFWECRKLESIDIEQGNPNYISKDGIVFSKDETVLIHYPAAKAGATYTVPDNITAIGSNAFDHNMNLKSIVLPESVTEIGEAAFWRCQSLAEFTIPKNVTEFGNSAFSNCSSLTAFKVEAGNTSFKSIDGILFDASGETLLQCPAGRSGSYNVPEGVKVIGSGSFRGCTQINEVIISKSVTEISDAAFAYCEGLTHVDLGGVNKIGGIAFQACFELTGITIPAGVTGIDAQAFDSCEKLRAVYFMGSPPRISGDSFQNNAPDFSMYYHYSAADAWGGFSDYTASPFCVVSLNSLGSGELPDQNVSVGGKTEPPAAPENPGLVLSGWYKDEAFTDAWDFDTDTASEDITLYARWIKELGLMPSDADGKIYAGEQITLTPSIEGGKWDYDKEILSLSGSTFTAVKTGEAAVSYSAEGQTAVFVVTVTEALPSPTASADATAPADTPAPEQGFPWIIVIAALGAALLAGIIIAVMRKHKRGGNE